MAASVLKQYSKQKTENIALQSQCKTTQLINLKTKKFSGKNLAGDSCNVCRWLQS
jgi:hypothetical protein